MKFKLETLLKRRAALQKKLHDSQYHYQGNIAVPNGLRNQWHSWKWKMSLYDQQIREAVDRNSDEHKQLLEKYDICI